MKKKLRLIGFIVTIMIFGMSFVSCLSSGGIIVDNSFMNKDISVEEQSFILVHSRIVLDDVNGDWILDSRQYNRAVGKVYIIPAGNNTFKGTYTYYRTEIVQGNYGSWRTWAADGTIDFNISKDLLSGKFYYMVGSDEPDQIPESINILTEEELNNYFTSYRLNQLKDARISAEKQIKK